ncbi:hypothetical protein E2562_029278 [Oryza meyeriana var. granulata]|uniref:Uncharacterized protein n=1 Tax=Oryza meyeriana var. granulata TaxID=110450 RepID=A0A6G1BPA1_9ORYZ|nr:hypothetical protein E2562_029278 [Oryza meyeriana var. granulata]
MVGHGARHRPARHRLDLLSPPHSVPILLEDDSLQRKIKAPPGQIDVHECRIVVPLGRIEERMVVVG